MSYVIIDRKTYAGDQAAHGPFEDADIALSFANEKFGNKFEIMSLLKPINKADQNI